MADGGKRTVTHTHPHWHFGGGEYHHPASGERKGIERAQDRRRRPWAVSRRPP